MMMMKTTTTTNWSNSFGFCKPYNDPGTAHRRAQRQLPACSVAGVERAKEAELPVAAAAAAAVVVVVVAAGSNHRCY